MGSASTDAHAQLGRDKWIAVGYVLLLLRALLQRRSWDQVRQTVASAEVHPSKHALLAGSPVWRESAALEAIFTFLMG